MRLQRSYQQRHRLMGTMNVTPFVDVVLVLLIVFMITAPLLTVGINVTLPKTRAGSLKSKKEPVVVTIRRDGRVFVHKKEVSVKDLDSFLKTFGQHDKNKRIFLRGDERVAYGLVMQVMGKLHAAGYQRISLVTSPMPETS